MKHGFKVKLKRLFDSRRDKACRVPKKRKGSKSDLLPFAKLLG